MLDVCLYLGLRWCGVVMGFRPGAGGWCNICVRCESGLSV